MVRRKHNNKWLDLTLQQTCPDDLATVLLPPERCLVSLCGLHLSAKEIKGKHNNKWLDLTVQQTCPDDLATVLMTWRRSCLLPCYLLNDVWYPSAVCIGDRKENTTNG